MAGFFVYHPNGIEIPSPTRYLIGDLATNTAGLFRGDLVVTPAAIVHAAAAAGATVVGVCEAFFDVNGYPLLFAPVTLDGTTGEYALVQNDPYLQMRATSHASFQPADIGSTADHVHAAGSTVTGVSGQTLADITNAQFVIIDVVRYPNVDLTTATGVRPVVVKFNEHLYL